jgi:osmotically-inducible protein OsmY
MRWTGTRVAAVRNEENTMATPRSDDEIQRDVLEELRWDARVAPNEIGVVVKNGVVTLMGPTDSFFKKWAAESAAQRVRGVNAIANELEVQLPSEAIRTDDQLAVASAFALDSDTLLAPLELKVTVSDGWVTITGESDWNYQREEAGRVVHRLWGVKGVTNLVSVRKRPTTTELKQRIEEALKRSAELDAKQIEVELDGSKAILKGVVRSWAEREEAERTAWTAPGITQVEDRLQVMHA